MSISACLRCVTGCAPSAKSAVARAERNRRLDSDAAAVQIMTVWVSKGLQYPIVYLPFAFNRNIRTDEMVLFHEDADACLHIGGETQSGPCRGRQLGRREAASDDIRLTYVALTRAQSQVVAWWAPSGTNPTVGCRGCCADAARRAGGAGPLQPGQSRRCRRDAQASRDWAGRGRPVLEESLVAAAVPKSTCPLRRRSAVRRHFHRNIDRSWRRTSYSGLIRAAETAGVCPVSRRTSSKDDEAADMPVAADAPPPACGSFRRRWPTCRRARSSAPWCMRCWRPRTRSPPNWPPN